MPKKAKASSGDAAPTPKSGPSYWLFKTEPEEHSWEMQKARGKKGEPWTGVRNFRARSNMKDMQLSDRAFFYHTGDEKQVVGIVEVCALAHQDATDDTGVWKCVDVRAVMDVPKPVTYSRSSAPTAMPCATFSLPGANCSTNCPSGANFCTPFESLT